MMYKEEIGLLVNGPPKWYRNLYLAFLSHGWTWLQQNRVPDVRFVNQLKELINKRGFFYTFGYVQRPNSKVQYRFKIGDMKTSNVPMPPPDNTAPEFADYDITQGKCSPGKLEYQMWLKVIEMKEIPGTDFRKFVKYDTRKNLGTVRNVVACPVIVPYDLIDVEEELQEPSRTNSANNFVPEEIGISISLEKDLQKFILTSLNTIEEGLRLYTHTDGRNGVEFDVLTGRIDLLCVDKDNKFVAIEIKSGTANLDVYSQIKSYLAALITAGIAKDKEVRGIIIAKDFDKRLIITVQRDPEIKILSYNVKFDFREVIGGD